MGSNKRKHSRERRRRVQVSPHSSEDGPTSDAAGPDADGDVPVNEGSEECDPSQRSTDWEREAEEAAPRLPTAKKKPRHHGPILAAHRSRGNRRQCTTPTRQGRRSEGAAASGGPAMERGVAPPLIPKPPAAPPPPGLRHNNVTLRAPDARRSRATAADPARPLPPPPGPPGPPRGRTPEEHLRLATDFAESLDELEASCFTLRGRLKDVRYYVSVHCLMLSREFEMNR